MRHEMILVCNAIQRDLQHPNEYIRGNTLRYLNKLKEPELLETLVPNVRQCLEHRHAYVRKMLSLPCGPSIKSVIIWPLMQMN